MLHREFDIVAWATHRNFYGEGGANPIAQATKTQEEAAELFEAIAAGDREQVKDAIGDIAVTLIVQSRFHGYTMDDVQSIRPDTRVFVMDQYSVVREIERRVLHMKSAIADMAAMPVEDRNTWGVRATCSTILYLCTYEAEKWKLTLDECIEHSYQVIKDRTGSWQNGKFVKDVPQEGGPAFSADALRQELNEALDELSEVKEHMERARFDRGLLLVTLTSVLEGIDGLARASTGVAGVRNGKVVDWNEVRRMWLASLSDARKEQRRVQDQIRKEPAAIRKEPVTRAMTRPTASGPKCMETGQILEETPRTPERRLDGRQEL